MTDDALPLARVRIAVTRSGERNTPLVTALRSAGATVHELPLTRVESLDPRPLRDALDQLAQFQWVLLTSVTAVDLVARALTIVSADRLRFRKLAVVGAATAQAAFTHGWEPTVITTHFHADALVDTMSERDDVDGSRMFYPAAEGARDVLPAGLRALGAFVDVVAIYRSAPDPEGQARMRALATAGALDLVTMAAPSAVDAILDAVPVEYARRLPVACIGPVTARAARVAGFPVKVESTAATADGFVRSIVAAFTAHR